MGMVGRIRLVGGGLAEAACDGGRMPGQLGHLGHVGRGPVWARCLEPPNMWSTLCREKPVWKALLGRLAPSAHRGPPGNLGQMACVGSPALW